MTRSNELGLEWGDLGEFVRTRPGGIEDWLMAWKTAAVFGTLGSLVTLVLALVIPRFSDDGFAAAYGVFGLATAAFAVMIVRRVATIMKFETGPRLIDIPQLSRSLRLASMLVLPCLILQISYPIRIVVVHQRLTPSDVKSVQDLVRLYGDLNRTTRISFPIRRGENERSVDPGEAQKILDGLVPRVGAWPDQAIAAYDGVKALLSRYPDLGSEKDLRAEQTQVNGIIKERTNALAGMNGEFISREYKSRLDQISEKGKQEEKNGMVAAARAQEALAAQLGVSDKDYLQELPKPMNVRCRQPEGSFICGVLYRLDVLSQLRARSFGEAVIPNVSASNAFGVSLDSSLFGASLYALLFGWQGVLPILVIAATFGVLLRIQRLTDVQWPYVGGAIGIMVIVIWQGLNPTKSIMASMLGVLGFSEMMPDASLPFALVSLALWLLVTLSMATSAEESAGVNKQGTTGINIRLAMLALPAIPLLLLIGWDPPGTVVWLIWPLAAIAAVALVGLIPWLDRLMLEANCRPRSA